MNVEKSLQQKVVRYLKQLGLGEEQALAYLFLLQQGPQTVLALSRGIQTGRTKLYPLLDDLAKKQLITIHERHYGTSYEAQPPDVLEFLIAEKERKAEVLRSTLEPITHALETIRAHSPTTSKILEYRGVDGLKQMNYNLTKAEKEYRVFELAGLDKHLGSHFADKMRTRTNAIHTRSRDLTNNPHRAGESGIAGNPLASARYIDPAIFTIEFETYIYNNCVALLSYNQGDIFGVEIHNDKLARQQKQLFDLIWSQARVIA